MQSIPVRQIEAAIQPGSPERFTIRALEEVFKCEHPAADRHRHNFYYLLAVERGRGEHEIDFVSYPVSDGAVFVLRPGQVHQVRMEPGCTGYMMAFGAGFYRPEDEAARQRFRRTAAKNCCYPPASGFKTILATLGAIHNEYTAQEEGFKDAIRLQLELLFLQLVRYSCGEKNEGDNTGAYAQDRLEAFMELVEQNLCTRKQVSEYAAMLHLSVYQLNAITKAATGKPASVLITEAIVLEASRQLLGTAAQVKDIAWNLGYEDVSYFIRFFRKHTGQSPESFRRNFG